MFTPAVLVFALLLGFSLSFAGKKSQVESVPQEEMEVSGAADDGVDPFITKNREWFKQYHTTGYYDWIGPNGETITGDDDLVLTNGEVKKLREGNYTYALIANNMAGEYMVALADGLDSYFNHLGIKRVAFTTAEFDPAKQKSDVETVLAKKTRPHYRAPNRSDYGGREFSARGGRRDPDCHAGPAAKGI